MKNFFSVLFFVGLSVAAAAQSKSSTDTSKKEEIGTTAIGLPVHKSYVAADAVERAKKKYGRALYSIEKSAAPDCEQSYLVGLIRKGKLTIEWMCDDPKIAQHQRNLYPQLYFIAAL